MDIIGAVKLKNAIKKLDPTLTLEIKNQRINGRLDRAYGFVTDPATQRCVYISTEQGYIKDAMYRNAKNNKDYTGGTNQWCKYDVDTLAHNVVDLVHDPKPRWW
jgi:hypothetical protein